MQTQSISNVLDVIDTTATARTSSARFGRHHHRAARPRPAGLREHLHRASRGAVLRRPRESAHELLGQLVARTRRTRRTRRRSRACANRRIPLLATLPNAGSGHTQPGSGWPVVIFQHGITLNRTVMFAMADAFAQAGFAVVAIDLPLHGVTDTASPFYQGANSPFGNNERHFNLDNVGATGVFAPDGQIDNGWQILNVGNPLNARDHIRQAVADSIALTRTLPGSEFPGRRSEPRSRRQPDPLRRHLARQHHQRRLLGLGHGRQDRDTLEPRRPVDLDPDGPASRRLRRPIRAVLSAQGLPPGTVGFDNFVRDLQTVIDPVDPINYAADAAANHPLHVIEVLGDTAVPNAPERLHRAALGTAGGHATTGVAPPATVSGIVRFRAGVHSSLFNPAPNAAVTTEMQRQTVTYAASARQCHSDHQQPASCNVGKPDGAEPMRYATALSLGRAGARSRQPLILAAPRCRRERRAGQASTRSSSPAPTSGGRRSSTRRRRS